MGSPLSPKFQIYYTIFLSSFEFILLGKEKPAGTLLVYLSFAVSFASLVYLVCLVSFVSLMCRGDVDENCDFSLCMMPPGELWRGVDAKGCHGLRLVYLNPCRR
jgi:hypothetical protein